MMREKPHELLLNRDQAVVLAQSLKSGLDVLEEVVNYGTNLIARCYEASDKRLSDVVIIGHFLKHSVTLLDSMHVLISDGASITSVAALRGLIEVNFYIKWILKDDTDRRARLYFVWDKRRKLYWARAVRKGTPEHKVHAKHMKGAPVGPALASISDDVIDEQIDILEKSLRSDSFKDLNDEFERKQRNGRDRPWYQPGGCNSVREIAIEIEEEWAYKVFYSNFSQVVHGDALDEHISFDRDGVVLEPIRFADQAALDKAAEQIGNALTYGMFEIYLTVLQHYRPGEVQTFIKKYWTEWRERYRQVTRRG